MPETSAILSGGNNVLAALAPELLPETYVFCSISEVSPVGERIGRAIAMFREEEGVTLVLKAEDAAEYGFDVSLRMVRIVLKVYSALNGVGLTAAVAELMAAHDIPCNVIAAFHHDHLFVPAHRGQQALELLQNLQASAAAD